MTTTKILGGFAVLLKGHRLTRLLLPPLLICTLFPALLSPAIACQTNTFAVIRTPEDGRLTKCVTEGTVQANVCLTNDCWGFGITNWILKGTTVDCKWDWDPGSGNWIETDSMADPDITGVITSTGFAVHTSGHAADQGITVSCTGDLSMSWPPNGQWTHTALSLSTSFNIEQRGKGTCSGNCSPNPSSNPGATSRFGAADVDNFLGPQVSFDLGRLSQDQDAGILKLDGALTTGSLSAPSALYVPYTRNGPNGMVEVITNGSGVIQQVKVPQGLVNVAGSNQFLYQVQFFYNQNVGTKTNGLYTTNATAFAT